MKPKLLFSLLVSGLISLQVFAHIDENNINDKSILKEKLADNILNVYTQQSGIYILRIESDSKLINRKIVKQ